jgi:hypothetical protein
MASAVPAAPTGFARIFAWRRLRFTLAVSAVFGVLLGISNETATLIIIVRTLIVGSAVLFVFGLFERWPKRLPRWMPRTVLRLIAIAVIIPFAGGLAYTVTTGGDPELMSNSKRMSGYTHLVVSALLFAPWIAVGAILKQRDAFAQEQAFAFELERSEFERRVSDARLRLLQAQVEPHFLFNTLANVRELVDSGSPQASRVLDTLITYLRAAVPRLQDPSTTLGQELQLVRSYLQLMQLRMDERLRFTIDADAAAEPMRCPPTTLLTLVENAIRHGIDPSEEGGRIDLVVRLRDGRVHAEVTDTGVGLRGQVNGLGTGLSSLRERLQLAFGAAAELRLVSEQPHGTRAVVEFPAEAIKA